MDCTSQADGAASKDYDSGVFDRGSDRLLGGRDGQAQTVQRLRNHSSTDLARIITGGGSGATTEAATTFLRSKSTSYLFKEQVNQLQHSFYNHRLTKEEGNQRLGESPVGTSSSSEDLAQQISSLEDDVRILQTEMKSSSLCLLDSGQKKTDHIAKRETKYYELAWEDGATGFKVTLEALAGDPDLFVSQKISRPSRVNYTWNSTADGDDVVLVPPGNAKFSKGNSVYIGVLGHERSSYNLRAKWILPRQAEYVFARKMNTNQRILTKLKEFKEQNKAAKLKLTNNLRKDLRNFRSSRSKNSDLLHRKSRWLVGADFDNTYGNPLSTDDGVLRAPNSSARFEAAMEQRREIDKLKGQIKAAAIVSTQTVKTRRRRPGIVTPMSEDKGPEFTVVKTLGGVDLEEPIKIRESSKNGKSRMVRNEISDEKVRRERFMMFKLR